MIGTAGPLPLHPYIGSSTCVSGCACSQFFQVVFTVGIGELNPLGRRPSGVKPVTPLMNCPISLLYTRSELAGTETISRSRGSRFQSIVVATARFAYADQISTNRRCGLARTTTGVW